MNQPGATAVRIPQVKTETEQLLESITNLENAIGGLENRLDGAGVLGEPLGKEEPAGAGGQVPEPPLAPHAEKLRSYRRMVDSCCARVDRIISVLEA